MYPTMAFEFDLYAPSMTKTCQFGCKTGIGKMFECNRLIKRRLKNPIINIFNKTLLIILN